MYAKLISRSSDLKFWKWFLIMLYGTYFCSSPFLATLIELAFKKGIIRII